MSTIGAPEGWLDDFSHDGPVDNENSKVGVIFVHGFTGSPASMRPWAHYFVDRGFTVRVVRLPGHGRTWQELNKVEWKEWPARVARDLAELRKKCSKVFIFGLSMGGCTTLNVAEHFPVDGIVLVNPMIHIPGIAIKFAPIISRLVKGLPGVGDDIKKPGATEWAYGKLPTKGVMQLNKLLAITRAGLRYVTAPTLLFHSTEDHTLPVSNTEIIMAGLINAPKERIELTNSYHVATMDFDAEVIFESSLEFVARNRA